MPRPIEETPADGRVSGSLEGLYLEIRGVVQGVGFRPFVYRLASELGLHGWVRNDGRGVQLELEGARVSLEEFLTRLDSERPPRSVVQERIVDWRRPIGLRTFEIRASDDDGERSALILPEVATCSDCLREILDETDRRFRYPFTNCTHCGPRFSIIRALPYDRPNTSMDGFEMCQRCQLEYDNPLDRRFHAQPNACPLCGPQLELTAADGTTLAAGDEALRAAAGALTSGQIVAVKGLGGFHLMADADSDEAVGELRRRKHRERKPMAIMASDLDQARTLCLVSSTAAERLTSPATPIVLLPRRATATIAAAVAPDNPNIGVMLAYTPLHHLLLREVGRPLVATSGNLSDEPICIDNHEALDRLAGIADVFVLHDRPILRQVDDSVVRELGDRLQPLRRARGIAPLPVALDRQLPPVLAVGAHLKNTVAISVGSNVFLSQHIGDMETPEAQSAFAGVIRDFVELYGARPLAIAHDLHPDYPTTQWVMSLTSGRAGSEAWRDALRCAEPLAVQHHHAHLASCLVDNGETGPALGVTWDGTGWGPDGTVWGGEFLLGGTHTYTRVARLRRFRLPGGERAVLEPRRVALALLWEIHGAEALELEEFESVRGFSEQERGVLEPMLARGLQAPLTSSAGRLFDGIAALSGLCQRSGFEGEAAMALELQADTATTESYPMPVTLLPEGELEPGWELDWRPTVEAVCSDLRRGTGPDVISGRFHNALAGAITLIAERVDEPTVALTGGCFQNRLLHDRVSTSLSSAGFSVLAHRRVPPNDGGICLGQIAVAASQLDREELSV